MEEGVFVESAFNMRYHIAKNTLLHIAFCAILPAGHLLFCSLSQLFSSGLESRVLFFAERDRAVAEWLRLLVDSSTGHIREDNLSLLITIGFCCRCNEGRTLSKNS